MTPLAYGARTPKGAEPVHAVPRPGCTSASDAPLGLLDCAAHATLARPRVLYVSTGLAPSGGGIAAAGRLLLDAVREWAARGDHALRVLTLGPGEELPAGVDGAGFGGDRARLAAAVWRSQLLEGYRVQVYDFLGVARLQGVLPRRLRARYLVYLHGVECWRPLSGSRDRALRGAAVRLTNSRHTAARLAAANPSVPEVAIVPLAIPDGPRVDESDREPLPELGSDFVLVVGRMASGERYKGHDELLAAIARLAPSHPQLRLVVAGDGDDRQRLTALAAELGVADRVSFTGFVPATTLARLYRRCRLFAMPSTGEGFGLVYLEAMRAGKPCLGLRASAAAEILLDGVTGRLVEEGVEPLVTALDALLRDPAGCAAMGRAGRERWQEEFRSAAFTARLRPHLDALLVAHPL